MERERDESLIRVIVRDCCPAFREGTRVLLAPYPDIEVVAETDRGAEALRLVGLLQPTILLTDINVPDMCGIEFTRRVYQQHQDVSIAVFTVHEKAALVRELVSLGVKGVLSKNSSGQELAFAIQSIAAGRTAIISTVAQAAISTGVTLTPREHEVLMLIAGGLRNREIATRLYISENTVEFHIRHLLRKLDAHTRTEAVAKASSYGIEFQRRPTYGQ
jgi:DNA-binding NarL/FixJ family response regulator